MHRIRILPRLTLNSMKKSASSYLPYIFATSFAVFVFFIFSSISGNPIMRQMPHAGYLLMLMEVGKVLLGIILVPFLFYTNGFLMKRRRREMGLYSILGLEKKHIGLMVAAETVAACLASLVLGIVMALVFSKLIFLLLLNISKLPVNIDFTANTSAYVVTAVFFGSIFLLNLAINLVQVFRSRPADLFQSARQGEKQPKRLWPSTLIGLAALGGGYYLAWNFELNSSFLFVFFGAVALVIIGTYCLFTSGIVTFLRQLKKNPRHYYRKKNFVTVSGMLYRMRKNAASLSNICVFSTMVIITLVCTVSLFFGLDSIAAYKYPYDVDIRFVNNQFTQREELRRQVETQAAKHGVTLTDHIEFEYVSLLLSQNEGQFQDATGKDNFQRRSTVRVLRLEDYNRVERTQKTLEAGEVLLFSTSKDLGLTDIRIGQQPYRVKEELKSLRFESKEPNSFGDVYYLVVADEAQQTELYQAMNRSEDQWIYTIRLNLEGTQQNQEAFLNDLFGWVKDAPGVSVYDSRMEGEREDAAILGGLLFLGIFFGIIFMVCMVMIMYYKQLSEGYEDKTNFDVMQQVGMSEPEVKSTIRRQILMVFFLPLVMALLHTAMALHVVEVLMSSLLLYNHELIVQSTAGVAAVFAVVYIFSYHMTAKAYYRIVRR